ncbi:predicted protein [Lichtheimia corymbifera JMRC:FSU:9682]|uniref:Uncharacterized protein n=1 Tax=Lichtheimia corymbifera JMRC:FSU:9682 TaxID=1263082 RepID=A0A068SBZ7_9FUNG|nr:predicted protein [Lichtheimia corymbifera JMRC:FSU:9682]
MNSGGHPISVGHIHCLSSHFQLLPIQVQLPLANDCPASTHHANPTTVLILLSLTEWGSPTTHCHSQPLLPVRQDTGYGHNTTITLQQRRSLFPGVVLQHVKDDMQQLSHYITSAPYMCSSDHHHHLSISPRVKPSNNKLKSRIVDWMEQHLYNLWCWVSREANRHDAIYCVDDGALSTCVGIRERALPTLLLLDHAKHTWIRKSFSWKPYGLALYQGVEELSATSGTHGLMILATFSNPEYQLGQPFASRRFIV